MDLCKKLNYYLNKNTGNYYMTVHCTKIVIYKKKLFGLNLFIYFKALV